MATKFKIVI